ncbi:MAG: hypothetical protein ACI957_000048 [Verrucomicrobiales bacterium]
MNADLYLRPDAAGSDLVVEIILVVSLRVYEDEALAVAIRKGNARIDESVRVGAIGKGV